MRLVDIKQCIDVAFECFAPKYSNSNGNYYIDNVQNLKKAIQALAEAGFISLNDSVFKDINSSITDRLILNGSQDSTYRNLLKKLEYTIVLLHEWSNNYINADENNSTTINIKLPQIKNLDELTTVSIILKKAFSRIVSEFGGELKVKQFDHGSYWIILEADSIEVVKFVGALVMAGWKITESLMELTKFFYEIKSMRLDIHLKELEIKELEEKMVREKAIHEASELNKIYFKKENESTTDKNERLDRIVVSLSEIVKLLKAGGEVRPALGIKNEIENIFPDFKEKSISYAKTELLEEKEVDSDVNAAKHENNDDVKKEER